MIKILTYQEEHQPAIKKLLSVIDQEFEESIFSNPGKTNTKTPDLYWVATYNTQVVGTIGLIFLQKKEAVLKSIMVEKSFRGKKIGVSHLLLQTAINSCKKRAIEKVYLGTMIQFKAAQKFYLKHGFEEIQEKELPDAFPKNPIDKVFYILRLSK